MVKESLNYDIGRIHYIGPDKHPEFTVYKGNKYFRITIGDARKYPRFYKKYKTRLRKSNHPPHRKLKDAKHSVYRCILKYCGLNKLVPPFDYTKIHTAEDCFNELGVVECRIDWTKEGGFRFKTPEPISNGVEFKGIAIPDAVAAGYPRLPAYNLRDITVSLDPDPNSVFPKEVSLVEQPNEALYFKRLTGRDKSDLICSYNEIESYTKLWDSGIYDEPLFLGARVVGVAQDWSKKVFGLLLLHIEGSTLSDVMRDGRPLPDKERRDKWYWQIQNSLKILHRRNLLWGDPKADNVLIDVNDDAWLIGFGKTCTAPWVDRWANGTLEGDKQGVKRLKRMLL
ncbi:uncharacterized protein BO88DRAFT_481208 [Aspergillus vadensis CBS 113365]|uniref:Protein kinase domain-containing protein n=1 Tax=Aspergillus vadensis (strain CBS 113365 / IMI 142717 / IBT 24658) TaxID=1448311 RepID=A0A319BD67_ASPVC|nr:hypothetical protein BO88DRAFT_481208 [Aspergillus vadensis CBS 113365]PYH69894.1 hypothetical protein BO88DRAFT_481208 [Aspergillus vadensis CBS 113365]